MGLTNSASSPSFPQHADAAVTIMRSRAQELVAQLVRRRGHDAPPFLGEEYASLCGVTSVSVTDLGKVSGLLLRQRDGYVIKLNSNHSLARQAFSCAHEIGHLLLNELGLERYIQTLEYRRFDPQKTLRTRAGMRERLCDVAAAELLMPKEVFKRYLEMSSLTVGCILPLARTFSASVSSTAMRIAEVSSEPCVVTFWKPVRDKRSPDLVCSWCSGWYAPQGTLQRLEPVAQRVMPPSTLHVAYQGKVTTKSSRIFRRGTGTETERLRTEAMGFGNGETRLVISIATPRVEECVQ